MIGIVSDIFTSEPRGGKGQFSPGPNFGGGGSISKIEIKSKYLYIGREGKQKFLPWAALPDFNQCALMPTFNTLFCIYSV